MALQERLTKLDKEDAADLRFTLTMPDDHSEVYRSVVGMLEMSKDDDVVLEADEFRQLVLDEWDWTGAFLRDSVVYSATASRKLSG